MSDETGNAPRGGFGKWWIASAILMAVVVLGLVYVLFPRGDDATGANTDTAASSSPSTATDSPSSTTSTTAPEEGGEGLDDEGCNGTEGSSEIPTAPPDDVQWVPLGATSVPSSDEYGPRKTAAPPLRQCFQHSPTGALFAAINISAAGSASGDAAAMASVAREQMTDGPVRDQLLANQADREASSESVAAFRVGGCDASRCNLDLVMSFGGQLAQGTISVVWADGDWKLDGERAISASVVTTVPGGFVSWAPGM